MLSFLGQIDQSLFSLIYSLPHNKLLDGFFYFLSGIGSFGLVWFFIMICLIVWEEIKNKKELWSLVIGTFLSGFLVGIVIKNIVRRPRPIIPNPITPSFLGYVSTYSFPSEHATIAFAASYILSQKHKRWAVYYYTLATLIAFSRIYLGQHYPSDVLGGALLGLLIGLITIRITSIFIPFTHKKNHG